MAEKCYAIIVAGGTGSRFGGEIPKQFCLINDKPVLWYSVKPFLALTFPVEIIIVLPAQYTEYWQEQCLTKGINFSHKVVAGGITRFHSVKNALRYVEEDGVVAVHDGVRPLITVPFLEYLYGMAEEKGAVIPVVLPSDSLRRVENSSSRRVDRSNYRMVQTPQLFSSRILLDAYEQAYLTDFTDDATVVQYAGNEIFLAEGLTRNIKITCKEDLEIAERVISAS
ncbi:MAG: 2-C-methyl-D-erythritol 4-phosphate cytidylyltransferase [Bacteroidales bacterium]|nr:2-C-methyl-D-erythritol 4-phosphate cytidylyltransferase [Bacteroidales bacterium]MDD2425120.1 2-C-methyl-D-erythritol 4-phosphate cytidylyltransferase [Bacteroidales bacterium]MDD3989459.1 2-C-methyl-D-erythritol 4-phosphate cytidylyltransferase [Bacteroidales bacterium]MDD4639099.1 2-C-methyl-D-erythritol 4-phosphate cytidylyltransferase [Bacteroidales bacterium]